MTERSFLPWPRRPAMNKIGMNTAASEAVIVMIVNPISLEPFRQCAIYKPSTIRVSEAIKRLNNT